MGWAAQGSLKGPAGDTGPAGVALAHPLGYALPRAPKTGRFYSFPHGLPGTAAMVAGVSYAVPVLVQAACQPVSIGFDVSTTGAGFVRGALYTRGTDAETGTYVADLGEIDATVLDRHLFPTAPPSMAAGWWYVVLFIRSANVSVKTVNVAGGILAPQTAAAGAGNPSIGISRSGQITGSAWPTPWQPTATTTTLPFIVFAF